MASNYTEWYFQLLDNRLQRPISDSTGKVQVLTASSPLNLTLYSDANGSSQTNPMTLTNGAIRFWTASSVTSLDLSIITANGESAFLKGVTPSNHRVWIDPDRVTQTAVVAWYVTASGVTADTGMKITTNMRIKDAYLRVSQPCSGSVLDFGTTTLAASGFLAGCTVEVSGFRIIDEGSTTLGLRGNGLNNAVTATLQNIQKFHIPANATSALSLIYAMTTSTTAAGGGYAFLVYDKIQTMG